MRLMLRPMRHSSLRSPNMSSASHGMTWMKALVGGGSGRRMGGASGWLVEGDESPPSLLLSTRRCHASAEEVPGVEGLADVKAARVRYLLCPWTMRLRIGNAATPALSKRYARPSPTTLPGSSDIQNTISTMFRPTPCGWRASSRLRLWSHLELLTPSEISSRRSLGSDFIVSVLPVGNHTMPTILQTAIAGGLLGVTVYLAADVAGDYTTYVILRYMAYALPS